MWLLLTAETMLLKAAAEVMKLLLDTNENFSCTVASIRQRRCISNHGMLMVLLLLQLSVWSLAMVAAIEQRRCRSNRCCGGAHHQWRSVLNQGMNGRRTTCSSFQVQSRSSFALKERVHFFITWKASHVRVSCCLREWVMCFFFFFFEESVFNVYRRGAGERLRTTGLGRINWLDSYWGDGEGELLFQWWWSSWRRSLLFWMWEVMDFFLVIEERVTFLFAWLFFLDIFRKVWIEVFFFF